MKNISAMEDKLQKLLNTLKNNRENVPLEVLKTRYRKSYDELIRQIEDVATQYIRASVFHHFLLNPYVDSTIQTDALNEVIEKSQLMKQISHVLSRTYDTKQLYPLIQEFRKKMEAVIWPFLNLRTCLVINLNDLDALPVIYNTILHKAYENNIWVDREIDFSDKALIFDQNQQMLEKALNEEASQRDAA